VRAQRRLLVPKQHGGYRVAIQLDPLDTIIYTALSYECAALIEKSRVPIERKVACSYRVELTPAGNLFRKDNGWDDFHQASQDLAKSGKFLYVVTADIADFYNQIGHHRIRNALESSGVSAARAKNIENLLMNFTGGQSQGIPTGPSASTIFSEACLNDVDLYLMRNGFSHTRYVDDFRIFCTTRDQSVRAMHNLTEYLYTAHRLSLQTHKSRIMTIGDFIAHELMDPEELEEATKAEKLELMTSQLSGYGDIDNEEGIDLAELARESLVELFEEALAHNPMHLGLAKYLLRRATALRTGVLRELVLNNVDTLIPVVREMCHYLLATTKPDHARRIGDRFIEGCKASEQAFLPLVQDWLTFLLLSRMADSMDAEISALCKEFEGTLGVRPRALLALTQKHIEWVRQQKETWQNNLPWDKRAIIWSSQALSNDEMNYWLQRVQNAGDILDKAIAEAALNIRNA
jgi:hypothetical protein